MVIFRKLPFYFSCKQFFSPFILSMYDAAAATALYPFSFKFVFLGLVCAELGQ